MTFSVIVLICSLAVSSARDCSVDNAVDVLRGPDVRNEIMCGLHGQAYVAETVIGRGLRPGQFVKLLCTRSSKDRVLEAQR